MNGVQLTFTCKVYEELCCDGKTQVLEVSGSDRSEWNGQWNLVAHQPDSFPDSEGRPVFRRIESESKHWYLRYDTRNNLPKVSPCGGSTVAAGLLISEQEDSRLRPIHAARSRHTLLRTDTTISISPLCDAVASLYERQHVQECISHRAFWLLFQRYYVPDPSIWADVGHRNGNTDHSMPLCASIAAA